ncbi:MAG: 2-(1,2-epoxy-1,2-dihydrophenyl)acetyl-CoA isomerase [Cytophagales bacterium]|nr:MAG: 2-(1,2-epoxy-1,2-dihydrophenyl)acetyl-CoA isomerase [Cytophagales bacterium]
MYQTILVHQSPEGIATITLHRPEVYNAITSQMLQELRAAFNFLEYSRDVKVIILTGYGKGFCAGQDLSTLQNTQDLIPSQMIKKLYNPLIMDMRNSIKPIICKLNGIAAGAGCSLALACDMIIASQEASISEAFINIGLVPDSGSTYFLPRIVGKLKAFEIFALGEKMNANEALELGLINKVYPSSELDEKVHSIALKLCTSATKSIGMIKSMLNQSYHFNLHEVLEMEAENQDIAANTKDFKEGIAAFLEKRKPNYLGQ